MDSSEAGRILPNPRQRGRAGSGQSSEVNSAEREESFYVNSNSFELDATLKTNHHRVCLGSDSASVVEVGTSDKLTSQAMTDVDFAMQFLNLPSTEASGCLFSSSMIYSSSENTMPSVLDKCSSANATMHTDHHYASDSEESDSAQTATDDLAPCQSLVTTSGSRDSCHIQLDSTTIIWPSMQCEVDEDSSRQLQERRKEKKRYIDRERKRYLRKTDKEYLEADREKAKLRMRMKRQDPQYRQREKDRNREHKRKSRAELKRKEQDGKAKVPVDSLVLEQNNDEVINRFPASHCLMENITSPLEIIPDSFMTLPSFDLGGSSRDIGPAGTTFQDYSLFPYSADVHPTLEPSFALDSNDST